MLYIFGRTGFIKNGPLGTLFPQRGQGSGLMVGDSFGNFYGGGQDQFMRRIFEGRVKKSWSIYYEILANLSAIYIILSPEFDTPL